MSRKKSRKKHSGGRKNSQSPANRGGAAPSNTSSGTQQKAQQVTIQGYSGPVPHPDILAQFDQIVPGSAEQIVNQFVQETNHRHRLERRALAAEIVDERENRRERRLGQIFGFVIALVVLSGSVVSSVLGAQWPGGILGVGGLAALVGVFVFNRKYPVNQNKNK
jgi:uncharacterized membrane protein